jgi:exoribonuclease-2
VQQQGITELVATLFKENMVRADDFPLVLPVLGAKDLPRGAKVRIKLGEIDEVSLDVMGTVIERLDTPAAADDQTAEDAGEQGDEDDDEVAAGPISINMSVADEDAAPSSTTASQGDNPSP